MNMQKYISRFKNNLNPKNMWENFMFLPLSEQMYWSKVVFGILIGMIFGFANFTGGIALLVAFLLYFAITAVWIILFKRLEPEMKVRSIILKGFFQYILTLIVIWTLIQNTVHLGAYKSNWEYDF